MLIDLYLSTSKQMSLMCGVLSFSRLESSVLCICGSFLVLSHQCPAGRPGDPGSGPPECWRKWCKGLIAVPFSLQVLSPVCSGEEEEEVRKKKLTPEPEEQVNTLLHSCCNILSSF